MPVHFCFSKKGGGVCGGANSSLCLRKKNPFIEPALLRQNYLSYVSKSNTYKLFFNTDAVKASSHMTKQFSLQPPFPRNNLRFPSFFSLKVFPNFFEDDFLFDHLLMLSWYGVMLRFHLTIQDLPLCTRLQIRCWPSK